MKKSLSEMHIFNIVDLFRRIARELRRLGAGSADRLADILDVLVLSDGYLEPAVAWAKALGEAENEGPYGEAEHSADDHNIEWEDRYAQCWVSLNSDNHWHVGFTTTSGHGLGVLITAPHYDAEKDEQVDGEIEVISDNLKSERFWGDDEGGLDEDGNASVQVVESRESSFLDNLEINDYEFFDREAKARVKHLAGE